MSDEMESSRASRFAAMQSEIQDRNRNISECQEAILSNGRLEVKIGVIGVAAAVILFLLISWIAGDSGFWLIIRVLVALGCLGGAGALIVSIEASNREHERHIALYKNEQHELNRQISDL